MKILVVGPDHLKIGGIASLNNLLSKEAPKRDDYLFILDLVKNGRRSFPHSLIKAIYIQKKFDIVHIQMASRGSCLRKTIFRAFCYRPVVIEIHGGKFSMFSDTLLGKMCLSYLRMRQNKILVLNYEVKYKLFKMGFKNVSIVSNCAEYPKLSSYYTSRNCTYKSNHSIEDKKAIYIGRISEEKGIDLLIKGWNESSIETWKLEIYGSVSTSYLTTFNRLLEQSKSVSYGGVLQNRYVYSQIEKAQLFLLTSYFEGQPVSLIESMACGVPFLASDLPGIIRLDPNSDFSFLYKNGDLLDFVTKLKKATSSPQLLVEMGQKAKEKYQMDYTPTEYYATRRRIWDEAVL